MRMRTVHTIFMKEMKDTLRDRRTLIFMIAVPIVAIPILMMGLSSLMVSQIEKVQEEKSVVVIQGMGNLPPDLKDILVSAEEISAKSETEFGGGDVQEQLKAGAIDALVVIPEYFSQAIESESTTEIEIYYDEAEFSSEFALGKVRDLLSEYSDRVVETRLVLREMSQDVINPFDVSSYNVAPTQKVAGEKIGGFLPYIVIIMCFMGAMYPAIDLAAGEKERGTLETLLVSPASRGEFVMGKYFVILVTGIVAALLSMASLTFSLNYMAGEMTKLATQALAIEFDFTTVILILMIVLPLAGIFAATLLSLSIFARSFKEAQSYITALNMLILFPAVISLLPGIELDYGLSLIPVVNVTLIIKQAIGGEINWNYVVIAFVSTNFLAAITLFFAKKWFEKESVLFRM